jgi:hypothetical protein
MKERYGRDEKNLSRAETPFCKGDSDDDGRDGEIFQKKSQESVSMISGKHEINKKG